ncbi:flagellar motor protein MotD [Pseudohalioglobus lutimaris]|uniref:Flagellar motor protein MotD n=1 Tax=Pseudohalioglobus lutimaris TaxID=1737061 RepID=A0A2N5X1F7_9GAMM|nr:flagellar motor protein MotD [Pseudohalioglobus lutimaris]PLW68312.1 flagellar motor protein MotD [Pseudohalioglobus lutimaris]
MARRARQVSQPINHERWMVSYADFITLLFAFFVVMYSISSVNEDKYRVLSGAMVNAFGEQGVTAQGVPADDVVRARLLAASLPVAAVPADADAVLPPLRPGGEMPAEPAVAETEPEPEDDFSQRLLNAAEAEVNDISNSVEGEMEEWLDDDLIDVKRNKFWLEVEIKSSLLFLSGSSELIPASVPTLVNLAGVFADLPNRIHVEGFTDDEPIQTDTFPSNWELSSARAAAVVRLFERNGIAPSRLASIGYGEHQPVSDNDSEEGRAKNRRVVVVVMASLERDGNQRVYEFEMLKEGAMSALEGN